MTNFKKTITSSLFIIATYTSIIFIFYFFIPWIKEGTIYFFRWDEGAYLYIYKKILLSGFIPDQLNYIDGIPNYIYPTLYLLLSTLLTVSNQGFSLEMASIFLQLLLFLTLIISSLILYKLAYLLSKQFLTSFLTGIFFIILPVVSYRLFYSHATFYANFVGILFLLSFLYYFTRYRFESKKIFLALSILFYSLTLFTHQLVFLMSSIILTLDFFLKVLGRKNILHQLSEKTIFIVSAILLNFGYLIRTPIIQKILSILGLEEYEQFGKEVVTKQSADALPQMMPDIMLGISITTVLLIFLSKKHKHFYLVALFHCFIVTSILLNYVGIHLPASFRYDSFYIITIPILLSYFFTFFNSSHIKILLIVFTVYIFSIRTSSIVNGFSITELQSLEKGLNTLKCKNTVSYFRIAPWIPVVSDSSIYYAHVDIYNAHQDRMDQEMIMFSSQEDLNKRLSIIKKEKVDCLLYEKNILTVDGIRVKGWEPWRYKNLYAVSSNVYEDRNLVIFKFF